MGVLEVGGNSFLWGGEKERAKARKKLNKAASVSSNNGVNSHCVFRNDSAGLAKSQQLASSLGGPYALRR